MTTFNRITLDIPDGWEDATLVTLLGPEPKALDLKSHKTAEAPERPNLVLKRLAVHAEAVSLDDFAAAQEDVMKSLVADLKVAARETLDLNGKQALVREFTFTAPPRALRQWQLYLYIEGAFLILCGTAMNDARFDAEKARFVAVAKSLRFT